MQFFVIYLKEKTRFDDFFFNLCVYLHSSLYVIEKLIRLKSLIFFICQATLRLCRFPYEVFYSITNFNFLLHVALF